MYQNIKNVSFKKYNDLKFLRSVNCSSNIYIVVYDHCLISCRLQTLLLVCLVGSVLSDKLPTQSGYIIEEPETSYQPAPTSQPAQIYEASGEEVRTI